MRVLLISFSELPTLQNLLYITQSGLESWGVDCWTLGSAHLSVNHVVSEKNLLIETPDSPKPSISSMMTMKCSIGNIVRMVELIKPDIVHFVNKHTWNYFLCVRLKRHLSQTRLFHTFHDPIGHNGDSVSKGVILYHKLIQQHLDGIIVMSAKAQNQTIKVLRPSCSVTQIPFGEKEWLPFVSPESVVGRCSVLIFGRINPYKGVDFWPAIGEALMHENPLLTIVVAGKSSDDVDVDALESFGAMPNVELNNRFIEDHELTDFFRKSLLVLMPYTSITQSGVLLDAYRHGRAVVAFNVDGMAQNVPNAANLINPFDCGGFAARVASLCSDGDELESESKKVWEFGKKNFSTDKMSEALLGAYSAKKRQ